VSDWYYRSTPHSTLHFGIPSPHFFPQIDIPGEGDTSGTKRVAHVLRPIVAVTPFPRSLDSLGRGPRDRDLG